MGDNQPLETVHDRRITWGLIAIVLVFVLVMSAIVLWVTSSLIRSELGGGGQPASTRPLGVTTSGPEASPTALESILVPLEGSLQAPLSATGSPLQVEATWTPWPHSKEYVRFMNWYVKPNRVTVGQCVQITWATEYAASLQLFRNDELILDNAPANTTVQDCPKQPGYAVYRLVGVNGAGESNWIQLQVKVQPAP